MRSFLSLIAAALIPLVFRTAISAEMVVDTTEEESLWVHQHPFQHRLFGVAASKGSTSRRIQQRQDDVFPIWTNVGQTLIGSQEQPIGGMVKLSADGQTGLAEGIATNTFGFEPIPRSTFTVNVHTYSKVLSKWIPYGNPVVVTRHDGQNHMWAMDFIMDKDGFGYLAIGDVQIVSNYPDDDYKVTGTVQVWYVENTNSRGMVNANWVKTPGDISYGVNTTALGASLALSNNYTVALGAPSVSDDPGFQSSVLVCHHNFQDSSDCDALGSPIVSSLPLFGMLVKISDDGSIVVAIGGENTIEQPDCQVQAFHFDEDTQEWSQMGQTFPPLDDEKDGFMCIDMDLSSDGQTVVVGGSWKTGDSHIGHVRVYRFDKKTKRWIQKGQDLDTVEECHSGLCIFGTSPQISADGNNVVLGFTESDEYELNPSESVLTFEYSSNKKKWIAQGSPLSGQHGSSGAISMSDDGQFLAVGASDGAESIGVVKTYEKEVMTVNDEGVVRPDKTF